MEKERLSKLQKWILEKCSKDLTICFQDVFAFFGKKDTLKKPKAWGENHDFKKLFGENYKKEFDVEKVKQTYSNGYVWKGKKISRKKELCITNSEKAVISRSLKGLVKKGFLIQTVKRWGEYRFTEEGLLKANKSATSGTLISFNEYQMKIEKSRQEWEEDHKKRMASIMEDIGNIIK